MKKCNRCKEEKEESEFYPYNTKRYPGKLKTICKGCENKKSLERYYNTYRNDPEFKAAETRRRLERQYGITKEDYEGMYHDQEGRCLICSKKKENQFESENRYETLYIDHCHERGKVRGLLCRKCNLGIGYFKDCPDALTRAAEYVKANNEKEF